MSLKLSYNTWAYSSYPSWLPAYTLEETIKRLAAIGYDGIEIGAAGPHAYPPTLSERRRVEIKKVLDGEGITLSSMLPAPSGGPVNNVSSPVEEERAYTTQHYKDLIDLTAQWGGKTVIYIPGWIVFGTTRAQALEWSQQALAELADYAAPQGIQLVIEPTSYDSNLIDTEHHAIELMQSVNRPNVGLMFDTFHVLYRREVNTDYVYTMGKDLRHIHMSEVRRLPPGHGECDFPAIMQALKDIKFDGYVTMEIGFDRRDVEPDWFAREAFTYLKPLT